MISIFVLAHRQADHADDPALWGYILQDGIYVPDPSAPSRFQLHLLGGFYNATPEMQHVIRNTVGPPYDLYYDSVVNTDLVMPAFGTRFAYDKDRASSTMGVAATAGTPLVVTPRLIERYG